MTDRRFIYFVDPMCSWCWGFSPIITKVVEQYCGDIPIEPIMGGLRPGTTEALDSQGKDYIRGHWEHVRTSTNQPFDFTFFDRENFIYDTEPACRAVVTMRRMVPEQAMGFLARIQRAFYADGRDITSAETIEEIAVEHGIDSNNFMDTFSSEETRAETLGDFNVTRQARVPGFPALVAGTGKNALTAITTGFAPWQKIETAIEDWLKGASADVEAGTSGDGCKV